MSRFHSALAALLLAATLGGAAHAQGDAASAPAPAAAASASSLHFHVKPVDDAWLKTLPRDADAATQAYMDRIPPDALARSNAYFEGGYWLQLWNLLVGLASSWLLLRGRRSARLRDWAHRIGRKRFLGNAIYAASWSLLINAFSFPLDLYQGWIRERDYGMATQTFGPWFVEHLMQVGVMTVVCAITLPVLYAVFRRTGDRWWIWGTAVTTGLMTLGLLVGPTWIDPLFNTYKPVSDPAIKSAVLQLAKADGVPVDNVYEFDASRQTTRVSANVSGILGSAAVRLNDNLMKTSLPEIRAVMGHELGHFVMNHIWKSIVEMTVLFFVGFAFAKWGVDALLRRHGDRWGLAGVSDIASFPLFIAVISVFFTLATPVQNTMTRTQEIEADRFGLNLAREPLAEAEVDLKLTEYRKPDPSALEEFVFYDHPSTRFRIHDAMRWRQTMGTP